jgi:hypothetical protein
MILENNLLTIDLGRGQIRRRCVFLLAAAGHRKPEKRNGN